MNYIYIINVYNDIYIYTIIYYTHVIIISHDIIIVPYTTFTILTYYYDKLACTHYTHDYTTHDSFHSSSAYIFQRFCVRRVAQRAYHTDRVRQRPRAQV